MIAAAQVYQQRQQAVKELLARLSEAVDQHAGAASSKPADWGFVGDLAGIEDSLRELVTRMRS